MKKELKKYKVIQTTTYDNGYGEIETNIKEHYTKAVSEAQARSRVMHRLGYNSWNCIEEYWGGGYRMEDFKAEEIVD